MFVDRAEDPAAAHVRRIMGIETEYGIANLLDGHTRLGPDAIARVLFSPLVQQYCSSNIYTDNASRLYLDVGAHPEVATAECDSLHQLLAYDRAGDMTVHELAVTAEQEVQQRGIGGQVFLFKNNTDSLNRSYGSHENYLIDRNIPLKPMSNQLHPFLVTRQLICGSGRLRQPYPEEGWDTFPTKYFFSARAGHTWEGVSNATTRSRPVINSRDEPHADSSRYRRLHIIVGDSNMSETTAALKIGSTLMILEMIEAGFPLPDFELASEAQAISKISEDLTGRTPILLRSRETASALDIQRAFFEAAQQWIDVRPEPARSENGWLGTPNEQLRPVLDLWKRVLECFETGNFDPVDTEIDWVIKKKLLDRAATRGNLELSDSRLGQMDLRYHDIHPQRGLFHLLARRGLAKTLVDEQTIERAMHQPPQTTRAALRGRFLSAAREAGASTTVDWMRLKINGDRAREVLLSDPFASSNAEVDSLIEDVLHHH